jgi:SAM-dependent methyltransferase
VEKAAARAETAGLTHRFRYQVGRAEELPFEDNSFDLVTCQTVLMHLRDPAAALREMIRVTRPGGLILVAEPTHLSQPVLLDAIALSESAESMASMVKFQLHCQHGKAKLGEGNDLIGEALPALFAAAGLHEVEIRVNDRVNPLVPPYESDFARALVDEAKDLSNRDRWMWDRATTLRYFVAGDGEEGAFEAGWQIILAFQRRVTVAITEKRHASAGSGTNYIIRGRKPSSAD